MAFMLITTFALIPIKSLFGLTGIVVLLLILVLLSAFYLHRSVRNKVEDSQKAWYGMAAGVLLWQVTRYLPEIPGLGWLDRIGFLYWTLLALVTLLLWKRVLPIGLRFLLLAFFAKLDRQTLYRLSGNGKLWLGNNSDCVSLSAIFGIGRHDGQHLVDSHAQPVTASNASTAAWRFISVRCLPFYFSRSSPDRAI